MGRVSGCLLGLWFYQSWCFSRKDLLCEWNCSYQSTLCTFSSSKAPLLPDFLKLTVCSFQQEQTFILNNAVCHSQEPERSHQRTLTDRLPHSVPEQGASQQPVGATRQTCRTSLQLRPSSGSAWSAWLMAHTRASPHANSVEAWGPVLVSHRHLFSVEEETSTNGRMVMNNEQGTEVSVIFLSPSRPMPGHYLGLGHDCFLRHFSYSLFISHPRIQWYTV